MGDSYIDEEFYNEVFGGESVPEDKFPRYSKRATDVIDQLTDYQIKKIGLDNFSDLVQELIKKATAAQVEYYQLEGIEVDSTGNTESGAGFSLGKFSYSSSGGSSSNRQSNRVSSNALGYLEHTGLIRKNGVRISAI